MYLNVKKLLTGTGLIIGCLIFIKYNKYNKCNKYLDNQQEISRKDNTTNNVASQTSISLSINDKFLVKETLVNNENKWYDIIDEVSD